MCLIVIADFRRKTWGPGAARQRILGEEKRNERVIIEGEDYGLRSLASVLEGMGLAHRTTVQTIQTAAQMNAIRASRAFDASSRDSVIGAKPSGKGFPPAIPAAFGFPKGMLIFDHSRR